MRYFLFIALLTTTIDAQQQPRPPACTSAEHRQFDFWVGEWTVTAAQGSGRNSITKIAGGCALLEQWTGNSGFNGKSLNAYDSVRKRWHQTWVDSSGSVLYLDGEFRDGKMTLTGKTGDTLERITWTPQEGGLRQVWNQSKDDGKTWTVVFDGVYKKAQ
jgi:hypothetical protein